MHLLDSTFYFTDYNELPTINSYFYDSNYNINIDIHLLFILVCSIKTIRAITEKSAKSNKQDNSF